MSITNKIRNTGLAGLTALMIGSTVPSCKPGVNVDELFKEKGTNYHVELYGCDGKVIFEDDFRSEETLIRLISTDSDHLTYFKYGKKITINGTYILREN